MATRKETVTRVIDGDTFETASRKYPVRLANVDAKQVTVDTKARDKYARAVANVKVGTRSVNKQMNNKLNK